MCGIAGFFNGKEDYRAGEGEGQWKGVLRKMNRSQKR